MITNYSRPAVWKIKQNTKNKKIKNNAILVIFATNHNPLVPNMNLVIKKHLPIITVNPSYIWEIS